MYSMLDEHVVTRSSRRIGAVSLMYLGCFFSVSLALVQTPHPYFPQLSSALLSCIWKAVEVVVYAAFSPLARKRWQL